MYKQLEQRGMDSPPVNVGMLRDMKQAREPIACLTAYDASFAQLVDFSGADVVLVGDSLGMVIQGLDTTVPVTVDDMVYHARCVARGLRRPLLIVDMPFMSYTTPAQALARRSASCHSSPATSMQHSPSEPARSGSRTSRRTQSGGSIRETKP